jgi:hypothetical protein
MNRSKLDLVASLYLGFVILCGIIYTCVGLTPSSYGFVLNQIGAPEEGPVFGAARLIRADEYAGGTPFLQIAVRNGFRRVNETSFYREDLRTSGLLPLKDWSLVFKPELWAFFVVPPATAFSFYYALLMCGFLTGYFLLFRQMEIDSFVSASATVILYFSGFTQFWWTSFGSLVAGLPWILFILFAPWRWWVKALLFSWTMPVLLFSCLYPTILAAFVFTGIVLTAVVQPSLFRSPGAIAAVAIGVLITGTAFSIYYRDIIPVLQNTWYPGKRLTPPGTLPVMVVFSQIFPLLTFTLRTYRNMVGVNICEIAAAGSFLPILTFCLISPQAPRAGRPLRNSLIVLFAAVALITFWQIAPAPLWIGHLLLWDHGNPQRLLFVSGFLITVSCLLLWRDKWLAPNPYRIALFMVAGPLLSFVLKAAIFPYPWARSPLDLALCALGLGAGVLACLAPAAARLPLLLGAIALINLVAFGSFNPLQPAAPIFSVPQTDVMLELRQREASTPGHLLLNSELTGATLNGLGFKSVNHLLGMPRLSVFREYFPAMDAVRFDYIFNRYGYVQLTNDPLPTANPLWWINVPVQAFEPVRNLRTITIEISPHKDCSIQRGGAIERVSTQGNQLIIEGWAPWKGEEAEQELRVTSARSVRAGPLLTVKRPDISESKVDYAYNRSGFRLQLSSTNGRSIRPDEIVLVARGTSQGIAQLSGCGCP